MIGIALSLRLMKLWHLVFGGTVKTVPYGCAQQERVIFTGQPTTVPFKHKAKVSVLHEIHSLYIFSYSRTVPPYPQADRDDKLRFTFIPCEAHFEFRIPNSEFKL